MSGSKLTEVAKPDHVPELGDKQVGFRTPGIKIFIFRACYVSPFLLVLINHSYQEVMGASSNPMVGLIGGALVR